MDIMCIAVQVIHVEEFLKRSEEIQMDNGLLRRSELE